MSQYRPWPGFDITVRTGRLSASSAAAKYCSSSIQKASLNRVFSRSASASSRSASLGSPERPIHVRHPVFARYTYPCTSDERDRRLGQASVRVHDRVVGVLPSLVADPARRAAEVLDEPVAVEVAVPSIHDSAASAAGSSFRAKSTSPVHRRYCAYRITNHGVESTEP